MRTRFWIAIGALMALLIATLNGDTAAQSTAMGYLSGAGDYDWWTIQVTPGYCYLIWILADQSVDFDLYVYDSFGNLVCSSTGPGAYEACSLCAWSPGPVYNIYRAKVISVRGAGWYTIGVL